jgi:hypothetical protein
VLARVLSHLPDDVLSALAHGLERHAGRLEPGRLYGDYDGGGCAVGVMLRELSPSEYERGRLQFWARRRRHESVLTERVPFDRSVVTRLSHVEMCFDRTASTLCEHAEAEDPETAANATGRWMAEGCREHLRARSGAGDRGFFVPEEWLGGARAQRPARSPSQMPSLSRITRIRRVATHDGGEISVTVPAKRPHQSPAFAPAPVLALAAA